MPYTATNQNFDPSFFDDIASELTDRLVDIDFTPTRVLNIGAMRELVREAIASKHPNSEIVGFDASAISACDDLDNRPDLAVLAMPEARMDLRCLLGRCEKMLCDDGVVQIALIGAIDFDTGISWLSNAGLHNMHDLGDMLAGIGFANAVVDAERLQLESKNAAALIEQLEQLGCLEFPEPMLEADLDSDDQDDVHPSGGAQIEVVYAIAWIRRHNAMTVDVPFG